MVEIDTFLTTLYVMVDNFCKTSLPVWPKNSNVPFSLRL